MWNISELVVAFILSATTALLVTPIISRLAIKFNAVDKPDTNRKSHNGIKPSLGGLSIFIGAAVGFIYLQPVNVHMTAITIGALIMIITGMLDDIFDLKPLYKLAGQISAAVVVVSSGLVIEKLTLPFMGTVYIDNFGIILTILWIVAASNAINLIDGLDGLAAGVSGIGLASILIMGIMDYRIIVVYLTTILIGGCIGFLFHNFYPAKIFMGDTGALFLGYSIAVISMLGLFKNVAFFSFIVPIIVIAVPVFDTLLAIIRRAINKQGIATADRNHIHYQLIKAGYSHRAAVLIIYGFSAFFGSMAIVFNSTRLLTSLFIFLFIILGIQLIAELAGVTVSQRRPIMDSIQKIKGVIKAKQRL
ncbi:glycosyltransferase family 4 protein [Ornithinibacillus halophilus]|uniref:UDP-GlcNAc:undecaprenyl-phosphate GlcNAc-1-phosphate transferase n=1 Tax=Ornithinibacillus halophilus TaxID=930117 RepID=A0A1M5E8R4_9BACI|nr:MraY family glycosyltransferase [Ornithinibacillus halophilus]SHF75597.1 UDP-GlcNAc:undecaprenyl-phosphate GlcNAc-1-phosphate transferase [Ornithinibacillus halophilus]